MSVVVVCPELKRAIIITSQSISGTLSSSREYHCMNETFHECFILHPSCVDLQLKEYCHAKNFCVIFKYEMRIKMNIVQFLNICLGILYIVKGEVDPDITGFISSCLGVTYLFQALYYHKK